MLFQDIDSLNTIHVVCCKEESKKKTMIALRLYTEVSNAYINTESTLDAAHFDLRVWMLLSTIDIFNDSYANSYRNIHPISISFPSLSIHVCLFLTTQNGSLCRCNALTATLTHSAENCIHSHETL